MRSGKLRDVIYFHAPTVTRDTTGAPEDTWVLHATTRCGITHKTGREYFAADHERTGAAVLIRIRYLSTLTTKMRAVVNSVGYDIQAILPIKNNREMHLMCSELPPETDLTLP